MQWEIRFQPSQRLLGCFILPFDSWVNFTNYILQCCTRAVEEVGMEAKTDNLGVREATFFIQAISWGIVPGELMVSTGQKIPCIIPG